MSAAYFTFVVDLGPNVNPYMIADNLLRARIAETATRAAEGDVRISPRFKELFALRKKAELIDGVSRGNLKSVLRWSIRHPSFVYAVVKGILFPQSGGNEPEGQDPGETALGAVEAAERATDRMHAISKVLHEVHTGLFSPFYVESDPHILLELKSFNSRRVGSASAGLSDDIDNDETHVDATLLLHRSGIALLTFAVTLPPMDADKLIKHLRSDSIEFDKSIVSEAILVPYSKRERRSPSELKGTRQDTMKAGDWWRVVDHPEPITLVQHFDVYMGAIEHVARIGIKSRQWVCYSKLFIEGLLCCGSKREWLSNHDRELAGLVGRAHWYRDLRQGEVPKIIGEDLLQDSGSSFHSSAASAVSIEWDFGGDHRYQYINHLMRAVVVDHVLIQYWQLRRLDSLLSTPTTDGSAVEAAQEIVAYGLQEYQRSEIVYGSARDIAAKLSADLELTALYTQIRERLDVLGQIKAGYEARAAARRASRLAAGALFVAAFIALPNLKDSMTVLADVDSTGIPGGILRHASDFINDGANSAWLLFLIFLVVVTLVLIPKRIKVRRPYSPRVRKMGVKSNREIEVVWDDED